VLAILYEFSSPGIGAGGALGAVLLVLGLLGSSVLELEATALILMAIGFVAIGLEVKVPAHGLLAGTGLVALSLGALLLVDPTQYFGGVRPVKFVLLMPVLLGGGALVFLLARATRKALYAPPTMGLEALVGKRGSARSAFGPGMEAEGQVFVDGARWRAETNDAAIRDGEPVEVIAILEKPTRLRVRRVAAQEE
jgi:membrane-bound serine protease (ClpP class)